MILRKYLKSAEKFTTDNSPALLAAVAVVGTVTTAYLTGVATFKAATLINDAEVDESFRRGNDVAVKRHGNDITLPTKQVVALVWKEYVPAVGTGLLTVTCIVFSHRISTRRTMAMAAAYSITDKAFEEYKEKVLEKFGENKERAVRDDIQRDRCMEDSSMVVLGDGEILCYDKYSSRYFRSSMEEIKKAMNDTNYEILHQNYASLGDFYNRVGLSGTQFSEEVGWNSDHLLDIHFSTVISDDQRPCLAIEFHVQPIRKFNFFK